MAKFEFANLYFPGGVSSSIDIACTNTNELELLISDVLEIETQVNPPAKKQRRISTYRTDKDDPFDIEFMNVDRAYFLAHWITKWFCDHGWEPFSSRGETNMSFKRIQE
jgi:hypothetical protein